MSRAARIRLLVLGVGVVVITAVVVSRRPVAGSTPGEIRLAGNIDVDQVELSFRVGGRVAERCVAEGEKVTQGQVVGRLDSTDLTQELDLQRADLRAAEAALAELRAGSRPEEVAAAEAVMQAAQAQLDELLAGTRPQEVAAAEAAVKAAAADELFTRTDVTRNRALLDAGTVSPEAYDRAVREHDAAAAHLDAAAQQLALLKEGPRKEQIAHARAALDEARQRAELARKGPRQETIDQAAARVDQARAAVTLAETRLGYATLASPLTGIVLTDPTEPGEVVAAGTPLITVADLRHVWLRAYLEETDLGRVHLGAEATVTTDTYPERTYRGTLSFIAAEAEFTPRSVQTSRERTKLVYRVKIEVDNPDLDLKPGMPAEARLRIDEPTAAAPPKPGQAPAAPSSGRTEAPP
jgi:HlyD family secretion protein